jgi:hypothetical protein
MANQQVSKNVSSSPLPGGLATQHDAERAVRKDPTKGINLSLAHDVLRRVHRYVGPPGCCSVLTEHPAPHMRNRKAVTVGIVLEHRFAFYYWLKCKRELCRQQQAMCDADFVPPDLLTMDWHNDVGGKCDIIESEMTRLDQGNDAEVGFFCWAGLRSLNDGNVFPAVWLNAIGDVYAIIKQRDAGACRSYAVKDRYGKQHNIRFCKRPEQFLEARRKHGEPRGLIWDIDLDFFTQAKIVPDQRYTPPLSDKAIARLLDPRQEWVREVLWNLEGITIALEPTYTGGLSTSLRLFQQWERVFFSKPIFDRHCSWKPLFR